MSVIFRNNEKEMRFLLFILKLVNPFTPKPAILSILLCLTPDKFTCQWGTPEVNGLIILKKCTTVKVPMSKILIKLIKMLIASQCFGLIVTPFSRHSECINAEM